MNGHNRGICSRCGMPTEIIKLRTFGDCCASDADYDEIVAEQRENLPRDFHRWTDTGLPINDRKRTAALIETKVQRVLRFLKEHGPANGGEIAAACGLSRTEVRNYFRSPRWGFLFERIGRAKCLGTKWKLAESI